MRQGSWNASAERHQRRLRKRRRLLHHAQVLVKDSQRNMTTHEEPHITVPGKENTMKHAGGPVQGQAQISCRKARAHWHKDVFENTHKDRAR